MDIKMNMIYVSMYMIFNYYTMRKKNYLIMFYSLTVNYWKYIAYIYSIIRI